MKNSQFYDTISPLYFVIDFFLKPHKKLLIQEVNRYPECSILEIGVGQATHLKKYHSKQITGADSSAKMLQQAKRNSPDTVTLINMDAANLLQLNQKFDIVVLAHVLSTTSNPDKILEEAHNVLKTNGKIIVLNHFSNGAAIRFIERLFQPLANLFHFQSYFPLENLTALKNVRPVKAIKFGLLNSYQLLVFEKT